MRNNILCSKNTLKISRKQKTKWVGKKQHFKSSAPPYEQSKDISRMFNPTDLSISNFSSWSANNVKIE